MNAPTKEQIEGMVMMSIYLYGNIYNDLVKIEVSQTEDGHFISGYYEDEERTYRSVFIENPISVKKIDKASDELIEKLEPVIKNKNL